ncbi:MAG: YlzJ-like family protein [Clostridia bacterium]|nr:YlzJ-like family protein [Clostridia bacterium]
MIMHSIIPNELIFGGFPGSIENNFKEMEYLGVRVQVSQSSNNTLVIQRVISTSPKAYLNPKLQPGMSIE